MPEVKLRSIGVRKARLSPGLFHAPIFSPLALDARSGILGEHANRG